MKFTAFFNVFHHKKFRSAAWGYFGHMWELHAFWAFVPVLFQTYNSAHGQLDLNLPLISFAVISIGGLSCIIAGYLSKHYGSKLVGMLALLLSGLCCIFLPLAARIKQPIPVYSLFAVMGNGRYCRFAGVIYACRSKYRTSI